MPRAGTGRRRPGQVPRSLNGTMSRPPNGTQKENFPQSQAVPVTARQRSARRSPRQPARDPAGPRPRPPRPCPRTGAVEDLLPGATAGPRRSPPRSACRRGRRCPAGSGPGDEREQREVVGRVPPGGVEEQARVAAEPPPDPGEIGDARVREDERRTRVPFGEHQRVAAEGADPGTGVDRHRQPALGRGCENGRDPGMTQVEPLRPRVQLDPRAPAARHRSSSRTGSVCGSTRQNGTSRPPEAAAAASTASFASRYPARSISENTAARPPPAPARR
jgi:hypothetical protein